ncbi:MAG: DUF1800 family protein [Verrucomicrobiaceae bacterium]|nr:DUF1800 family protein [Verrucomicrobiaceae bacterium]
MTTVILPSMLFVAMPQALAGISVYPGYPTIEPGSTRQFTAYVPMTPNTVEWLVNDVVGGSATYGSITSAGLYVAPSVVPPQNVITIKARSTASPTIFGSSTVAITRKFPWLWSTYPNTLTIGNYQVSLNGANFAPDSVVLVNGSPVTTAYVSPTKLIANGVAAEAGTLQFAVQQPGAGGLTGNNVPVIVRNAVVSVALTPTSTALLPGATQSFVATVTGTEDKTVIWSIASGAGTINSATGVYTAPVALPASTTVQVRATSASSPSAAATASITLLPPPPPPVIVTVTPPNASVTLGGSTTFTATLTGTSNNAVSWSITSGGGSINPTSGVYTAPQLMPGSNKVTLMAVAQASSGSFGTATVTLVPPPPSAVSLSDARFLEQATFGPSPTTLAELAQKGKVAWLAEQFAMPETVIPLPTSNSMGELRQWCLSNYTTAPDQLRQRVAYSLGQIIVASSNKLIYPDAMVPWMRLLSQHAFGNYRALLHDMTLCPSMGKYLDLANSAKPSLSGGANENYARELMQLFSIGLWQLNLDGSVKMDAALQPIPAYDQETVVQVALALTGWVYAGNSYENFTAPMVPQPSRHDTRSKSILGTTLPSGQSVQQDLDGVIDCLMNHPNTAPFISTRLIRSLVTSNPSPAYIQRVATVFNDNGQGVKGDLKAVITAILMDAEARNDVPTANSGRLKEPILQVSGLLRALGGKFTSGQQLSYLFDYMTQPVLEPPSVFNWFSPLYRLPGDPTLYGPEYQIYSPTDATLRGNLFYQILHYPSADVVVNLTPFQPYGNDMPGLVEAVNQALLYGRMPAPMKSLLIDAATPGYDARTRIETVLYLTALSGQYAVQH